MKARVSGYFFEIWNRIQKRYWNIMNVCSNFYGKVLMFHNICDAHINTLDSCQCKVDKFEEILIKLKANGRVISVYEMLDIIKFNKKEMFSVVTFDDIPDNVYYNAFPLLKKYNIPFTIFISTEFVNKEGFISLEHLREMVACSLCTLGAHSKEHRMLRGCDDIFSQLKENKEYLESLFDKKVDFLAYPYGRHESVPSTALKIANELGFKCAFSTIPSTINSFSSRNIFFLPRIIEN